MTWLPVETGALAERDAVFGLKQEVYDVLRETLGVAWRMTDAALLDVCRLRLAELTGARAELGEIPEPSDDRQRAALAYAEQYHYDHRVLADAQTQLSRHLARPELVSFVWALHMNDAYLRALALLDVAPDPPGAPPRPERTAPVDGVAAPDGAFSEVHMRLNRTTVRQSLVDDETSEAVRLHNAAHQLCLY